MPYKRKRTSSSAYSRRPYNQKRGRMMRYLPRVRGRTTGFYRKGLPSLNYSIPTAVTIPGKDFMPERLRTKFNYVESISYNASAVPISQVFRGNSGFDPNQTGTGTQPVGWDDMSNFYLYNNIYASSIDVEIVSLDDTSYYVYLYPTFAATVTNLNMNTLECTPGVKKIFVRNSANSGHGHGYHFKRTNDVIAINSLEADVTGTFTANPGVQWYWIVYIVSADTGITFTGTIKYTMTYYTLLSGRRLVALST